MPLKGWPCYSGAIQQNAHHVVVTIGVERFVERQPDAIEINVVVMETRLRY